MVDVQLPDTCLGIPIDHRLSTLLGTGLTIPNPSVGGHVRTIENYGRRLQEYRKDVSDNEVKFASWLAMPETKGGVVIILQQPAEHQRYFFDHNQTVRDCDTLAAVDEVCKLVTGYGLEKISCFDAFPFHKTPLSKYPSGNEVELDKAYDMLMQMIKQKEPDVIFSCYSSRHPTKYKEFHGIGIGQQRVNSQVIHDGRRYTCVNGFHLSRALHYIEDQSELRRLFIMEAAQAFCRAKGIWKESSWMAVARNKCAAIARDDRDEQNDEIRNKLDFQCARFDGHMKLITRLLESLKAGVYDDMTDDELYHLVLKKGYNVSLHNCLLLLVKIINFEDRVCPRLRDKGFTKLCEQKERDVRYLKRSVEKICDEFIFTLSTAGAPLQIEKGREGRLTSANLNKSLLPLGPFAYHSGFHHNLRLNIRNLIHHLNSACIYKGVSVYKFDRDKLAMAFRRAACDLEVALAQHIASVEKRIPEEDLAISSLFDSLSINSNPQQTKYVARSGYSQTIPATSISSSYPLTPPLTPSHRPTEPTTPRFSKTSAQSPPLTPPQLGVMPYVTSPQAASPSRYRPATTCKACKKTGHSAPSCPTKMCYRCKNFGHMSFDCPLPAPAYSPRRRS